MLKQFVDDWWRRLFGQKRHAIDKFVLDDDFVSDACSKARIGMVNAEIDTLVASCQDDADLGATEEYIFSKLILLLDRLSGTNAALSKAIQIIGDSIREKAESSNQPWHVLGLPEIACAVAAKYILDYMYTYDLLRQQ